MQPSVGIPGFITDKDDLLVESYSASVRYGREQLRIAREKPDGVGAVWNLLAAYRCFQQAAGIADAGKCLVVSDLSRYTAWMRRERHIMTIASAVETWIGCAASDIANEHTERLLSYISGIDGQEYL